MSTPLVFPYGAALGSGLLKSMPEDFDVDEVLGFEPDGEGEHLFIRVEKTGLGTPELVSRLARRYGLNPATISHSGLKDKHAVTRQWLSLHLPGRELRLDSETDDGYRVLDQSRHSKKLRPGTHRANRFRVRLREVDAPSETIEQRIAQLQSGGFANYFGEQRFGSRQDNVERALRELGTRKLRRQKRSILLSSLRSYLFNRIVSRRIEQGAWAEPLPGDLFMLRGSHSLFSDEIDESIRERYRDLDISSCASLYGQGDSRISGEAGAIEQAEFEANPEITACLLRQQSRLQMRAVRAIGDDLECDYDARAGLLELTVSLPAGSYVTVLLAHLLRLSEPGRRE